MIFHQWRTSDQAPAEQRARILAEQEAIAARKKLDEFVSFTRKFA